MQFPILTPDMCMRMAVSPKFTRTASQVEQCIGRTAGDLHTKLMSAVDANGPLAAVSPAP